jgi:3-methyladenine DNA glycosylase AlkD
MTCEEVLARLVAQGDPAAVAGMARFGITAPLAYGVSVPALRALAHEIGRDHDIARALWATGVFEARLLAAMVAEPARVDEALLEGWALDFDNWAVCDGVCTDLFGRTPWAYDKAVAWSARREEYVKRAGFVLMARLAVTDKTAPDAHFEAFLPIVVREAGDSRPIVRKAINWALRQIGKRNLVLNARAIEVARALHGQPTRGPHWIATDALRELTSARVQARLHRWADRW